MADNIQGNSEAARTETGTLVNQAPVVTLDQTTTSTTTPDPTTTTAKTATAEPATKLAEGTSLLNEGETTSPVVPETYADFKVPEGYTLDKSVMAEAAPIFKEMNLTQAQAQKLVDFYTKQSQASVDKPYQDYLATRKTWQDQVKADFGNQLPEVKATIGRALSTLPPEVVKGFREAMDATGAGDNPAFVKAFYTLAKSVIEGRPVTPGGPSPQGQGAPTSRPSAAAALFPKLPSSAPQ